jgi:hypothetical protein
MLWHVSMSVLSTYGQRAIHFISADRPLGKVGKHSPMIAAEITGSVGVRQADMAKQDMKLSDGKSSNMNPGQMCVGKRS